jgi:hypothetical protein
MKREAKEKLIAVIRNLFELVLMGIARRRRRRDE